MSHTLSKLALCAALGMAVAGCNANQGGSAAASGSTPPTTASPAGQASSPAQPAATSPTATAASQAPTASPPATTSPATVAASPTTAPSSPAPAPDAGVVANCASAEPFALSREPSSIDLACADDDIRVEGLTWSGWTKSGAAGHGTLLENQCVPDCAEGNFAKYPVAVALSGVKSSGEGPWFSRLTVTWERNRPPNQTPDTFTLEAPGSPPAQV